MDALFFLVHQFPNPPNKCDKIRSFNLLRQLAKSYRIYLGISIDDPKDQISVEPLREYCTETATFDLHPTRQKIVSIKGLFSVESLTIPYYAIRTLKSWVRDTVEWSAIKNVLVFSSSMAQFADVPECEKLTRIVDFDSAKRRAYADLKSWPMIQVFSREARTLFAYELEVATPFDDCLFVSQTEADLFKRLSCVNSKKVDALQRSLAAVYATRKRSCSIDASRPGIQKMVLVAMAMAKLVIATPQEIEGFNIGPEHESLITEKVSETVDIGATALNSETYTSTGLLGRTYVERHHDWPTQLEKINTLFSSGGASI